MHTGVPSSFTWQRMRWPVEVLSMGLGYLFYGLLRLLAPHRVEASYLHAEQVLAVERFLRIDWELGANRFLAGHSVLSSICSYWYATFHFIVTPFVLVWLWKRRAAMYPVLRSALVLATGGALIVYATWPLAPPRYKLGGTVDTVLEHPVFWALGRGVSGGLVNDLAAMPSLHVAWAVWSAVAICVVFHSRWRFLAWLYPLGTTMVVVASANHYPLDALAGAVLIALPLWLCGWRANSKVALPARSAELSQHPMAA